MNDDIVAYEFLRFSCVGISIIMMAFALLLPSFSGVFSIIVALCGILYMTNTIRRTDGGYLSDCIVTFITIICSIISLIVALKIGYLSMIISIIISAIVGIIVGVILKHISNIEDTHYMMDISVSSQIAVIAMATFIASTFNINIINTNMIENGVIILPILAVALISQLAYNTSEGPNEEQIRTLNVAVIYTFLIMIALSIIQQNTYNYIYMIICIICLIASLSKFIKHVKHQAASIQYYSLTDGRNNK